MPADEAMTDLLAGELRALAVLGEARSRDLPGVPTAKELGHPVSVPVFGGIAAPAGTPRRVVEELGRAFVGAASSEPFGKALVGTGREPAPLGPEGFGGYADGLSRSMRQDAQAEE